jgi:hypothetical protein
MNPYPRPAGVSMRALRCITSSPERRSRFDARHLFVKVGNRESKYTAVEAR